MKIFSIIIGCLILYGCTSEIEVSPVKIDPTNVKKLCELLEVGQSLSEVEEIMDVIGVRKLISTHTNGVKEGSGVGVFWGQPEKTGDIIKDPVTLYLPIGDTCRIEYSKEKRVEAVESSYISDEEFQKSKNGG